MAEALVAVVLESFVSTIVDDLTSMAKEEMRLFLDAPKELDKISRKFRNIQEVIADAEKKQAKAKRVRDWLAELKDLAYDIDDIVDEWRTAALRSDIEQRIVMETGNKTQVCNFFSPCFCFNRNVLRYKTGHRIKDIKERLNQILQEMSELNFVRNAVSVGSSASVQLIKERQTTSLLRESEVIFGRDEDIDKMIDLLLNESSQQKEKVITISIVGMGGLGKTTLAQLVYANERVEKHFEKRLWVCVSDDFDMIRLTKAMIEDATKQPANLTELQPCQRQLREILGGNRFLIVLDDVWNEVGKKWDDLIVPLTFGAKGSRIIVTTRSEKVARIMHSNHIYNLEILSEDNCWSLFRHKAFYGRVKSDDFLGLEEIGKEILKKCKGLPLAAKTLGSVMNTKKTRQEWVDVKESEIWDLEDVENGILPALLLSYQDLPSHLRQCFTYCSIFPKDFEIDKEKLIYMWMAQGFLKPRQGMDNMEEVGNSYCDELLWRSLFQVSEKVDFNDTIISYTMHDLVSDMTRMIAGKECAFIEIGKPTDFLMKARHSSFYDTNSIHDAFCNIDNHLRTIVCVGVSSRSIFEVPQGLFHHSRSLRVLDLSNTGPRELPVSIENLKHLRYLDLSHTEIEELPESVTTLCNMRVLRLNYCFKLRKLPDEMGKMIGLRHILVQYCDTLKEIPNGIGRLSCLRTLTFYVGDDRCKIGEIKSLEFLCKLHIYHLEKVKNVDDAKEAELKEKKHLRKLHLKWDAIYVEDNEMERQLDVLEGLRPHTNLTMLSIYCYYGRNFPSWIGDQSFCNLSSVDMKLCNNCQILPPFGQLPSLKYLSLNVMTSIKNVGREFYGGVKGFPKLLKLFINGFRELEEWDLRIEEEEMPCLLYTRIEICPKLKRLPQLPRTLNKLHIVLCPLLKERYQEGGDDRHKISHVPNITIT